MTEYKIEKGVAIPRHSNGGRKRCGLSETLRRMDVGDSVFADKTPAKVGNIGTLIGKETGFRFTTRKEGNGARIWRLL
jgi:hypothetical protein